MKLGSFLGFSSPRGTLRVLQQKLTKVPVSGVGIVQL